VGANKDGRGFRQRIFVHRAGVSGLGAPITSGLLLAVPFASIAAGPDAGRAFARAGICKTAEERTASLELLWIGYFPGMLDPCPTSTMLGEVSRLLASGELGS